MADLQAQRTLVKSPPELWAELSNPESLGRRLSDFGEIRITRLIPEKTVAWEGERASGTVELESSGWGTKVRLTASAPEHDDDPTKPHATLAAADRITAVIEGDEAPSSGAAARSADRVARRAAAAAVPNPAAASVVAPVPPAEPVIPPRAPAVAPPPPARRGFFARLFGRRKAARAAAATGPVPSPPTPAPAIAVADPPPAPSVTATPSAQRAASCQSASTESVHAAAPAAAVRPAPASGAPGPTPAGRPQTAGPQRRYPPSVTRPRPLDPEQTLAVLSGVLDDLGAAHHRPFSRQ